MTDNVRGSHGPPWSVDLLADLHAGVLDADESARLWPQVNADPQAREVLAALDSVKVDLGRLGQTPVEPMPAQFAARLDAALVAETKAMSATGTTIRTIAPPPAAPAPVTDLAAARKRRNRLAAWGAGVLTAAAAAVAITVVALPDSTGGTPQAGEDGSTQTRTPGEGNAGAPMALSSQNLNPAIALLNGKRDYGPLENEEGLRACLGELGITAGDTVGVSPVTLDGAEGVGALLGAGPEAQGPGRFLLVVVTSSCEQLSRTMLPS